MKGIWGKGEGGGRKKAGLGGYKGRGEEYREEIGRRGSGKKRKKGDGGKRGGERRRREKLG